MPTIVKTHTYEPITSLEGPQDPEMDGSNLTFEPLEHGGDSSDACMPGAIKVTDSEGRWCIFEPTHVDGQLVRSHGYSTT